MASKLSEELINDIAQALTTGCHLHEAAAACNISRQTYYFWRRTGFEHRRAGRTAQDSLHVRLLEACDLARTAARKELVEKIKTAGQDPKHWQANAWILERSDPEHWGAAQHLIKDLQAQLKALTEQVKALAEQRGAA